jgi:hypothetical protein
MSIDQRALVAGSLTGNGDDPPGSWPVRRYTVLCSPTHLDSAPVVGDCVETRAGAYWHVTRVTLDQMSYDLELRPVRPHSFEAHGSVRPLRGGKLH